MNEQKIESWRHVWRKAVAPLLSTEGLIALKQGLERDDPALIQGATTTPPPLMCVQNWPVEAACAIGYAYWKGDGLLTVGETEEAFATTCHRADLALGEPAGVRHWLNEYDSWDRETMRKELLPEVELELEKRK